MTSLLVKKKYMNKFNRDIDAFDCNKDSKQAMKHLLSVADDEFVVDLFFTFRTVFGDSILAKYAMVKEEGGE